MFECSRLSCVKQSHTVPACFTGPGNGLLQPGESGRALIAQVDNFMQPLSDEDSV